MASPRKWYTENNSPDVMYKENTNTSKGSIHPHYSWILYLQIHLWKFICNLKTSIWGTLAFAYRHLQSRKKSELPTVRFTAEVVCSWVGPKCLFMIPLGLIFLNIFVGKFAMVPSEKC